MIYLLLSVCHHRRGRTCGRHQRLNHLGRKSASSRRTRRTADKGCIKGSDCPQRETPPAPSSPAAPPEASCLAAMPTPREGPSPSPALLALPSYPQWPMPKAPASSSRQKPVASPVSLGGLEGRRMGGKRSIPGEVAETEKGQTEMCRYFDHAVPYNTR